MTYSAVCVCDILSRGILGDESGDVLRGHFIEREDGEMAVDGFPFGLNDGAGVGIFDSCEKVGTEGFKCGEGEEVFFVEVGGDNKDSLGMELMEGVVEE